MKHKIFGCKVNKYYTDKWLISEKLKNKKGIFIASCVVTDNAKRKWIKFIKDIFKNNELLEDEKVYISGCGAFKAGKAQSNFFELYPELKKFIDKIEILDEDPGKLLLKEKIAQIPQLYTKKFVLIQGGCDSFCSFCLTVKKRGKHYYRKKEDILNEILEFEKKGGKEVVLTGINLSAWGLDSTNDIGKSRFSELIQYLLKNSNIPRLRISSLGPEFIDDRVLKIFENTRIYPHFHFSVQSGNSNVLKGMKRHYSGEYIKKLILKTRNIKRNDNVKISIGADIIVGFPGETEDNFKETLDLLKECNITKVHSFPFSGHKLGENVPAGFLKNQIPDNVKKQRMDKILKLSEEIRNNFIKENKGKELEVLIEIVDGNKWKGWTQNYIEADNTNFEILSGNIKRNELVIGKLIK